MSRMEQIVKATNESRHEQMVDGLSNHIKADVQEWIDEGNDRTVTLYTMTPREIFEAYLEWNGIIGYDHLYNLVLQLNGVRS